MTINDLPSMNGDMGGDVDRDEHERLNRYLDGLARDLEPGDQGIDPSLTATALAIHALAALDERDTPSKAEQTRSWQRLVQLSGMGATPDQGASAGPRPGIVRGVQPLQVPVTVGGSARLIATFAAVLVLVVSTLSLYQRVPGGGSTPTVLAAGNGAYPAAVGSTVPASPITTTTVTSTASVRPASATCGGTPAAYDDVRGTVVGFGEANRAGQRSIESSPSTLTRPGMSTTPWMDCNPGTR